MKDIMNLRKVREESTAANDLDVDGTPMESALAQITHLIRYEYRLKDHSPALICNTIEQVLDAYDREVEA